MDNQIKNDMPQYVKDLPQAVQDLVFDNTWENRVMEIAKKYNLNDTQADSLANDTLLVLIGLEKPETFLETIIGDLKISKLLAEQIMTDLENRVFEYALKFIEDKGKKVNQPVTPQPVKSNYVPREAPKVPEIKPDNLPAKTNAPVQTNKPPQMNLPKVEIPVPKYVPPTPPKPITPTPPVQKQPEPVQRSVNVPRFTAVPLENNPMPKTTGEVKTETKTEVKKTEEKPTTPGAQTPPKPQTPPTKSYTADPYREPLN